MVVDFLGKQLDDYVATLPISVFVVRMGQRRGLIRARLKGLMLQSICSVCSIGNQEMWRNRVMIEEGNM